MSYFDNGEEFGGDSDDNMDEAIYWNTSTQHTHICFYRLFYDFLTDFICFVFRNRPAVLESFNCF